MQTLDDHRLLIEACFDRLRERGVEIDPTLAPSSPTEGRTAGVADLAIRGSTRRYLIELAAGDVTASVVRNGALGSRDRMLFLDHASRAVAKACRDRGVSFVDTAGNMLIDTGQVLLDVEGRPRSNRREGGEPSRTGGAFSRRGLQVTFALLVDPDLALVPQRDLAAASGASVGTVNAVLADLERRGHLERAGRRPRRLARTGELLDRWVDAHAVVLMPTLSIGRFEPEDPRRWLAAAVDLSPWRGQWGTESAAAVLDGWLKPGQATVYVDALSPSLMRTHRLVPRDDGAVELRRRFWGDLPSEQGCAPTLLVYADLMASGGAREREAATILRRHHDLVGPVRDR